MYETIRVGDWVIKADMEEMKKTLNPRRIPETDCSARLHPWIMKEPYE
ncbi:hypothetical protein [Bacillus vallismortis]|nr:hypothetical protein [Bacillus vallismortis]MCI4137378.1 hypothetical protein [Bacillus vallismortis]